jgi:hypothetical protein
MLQMIQQNHLFLKMQMHPLNHLYQLILKNQK